MQWYDGVPDRMDEGQSYAHGTIVGWLKQVRPHLSSGGYHWAIDQLIHQGAIVRKGYDEYCKADGTDRTVYSPAYSEKAIHIMEKISAKFPYVTFTVFETFLMNRFLNHLIGNNIIFLQVEKESSIYIFRYLQEEGYSNLLYKPKVEDFYLYWASGMVIISDLISEAPLRKDQPHAITLEKKACRYLRG